MKSDQQGGVEVEGELAGVHAAAGAARGLYVAALLAADGELLMGLDPGADGGEGFARGQMIEAAAGLLERPARGVGWRQRVRRMGVARR